MSWMGEALITGAGSGEGPSGSMFTIICFALTLMHCTCSGWCHHSPCQRHLVHAGWHLWCKGVFGKAKTGLPTPQTWPSASFSFMDSWRFCSTMNCTVIHCPVGAGGPGQEGLHGPEEEPCHNAQEGCLIHQEKGQGLCAQLRCAFWGLEVALLVSFVQPCFR